MSQVIQNWFQRGFPNPSKIDENPALAPQVPSMLTLGTPRFSKCRLRVPKVSPQTPKTTPKVKKKLFKIQDSGAPTDSKIRDSGATTDSNYILGGPAAGAKP